MLVTTSTGSGLGLTITTSVLNGVNVMTDTGELQPNLSPSVDGYGWGMCWLNRGRSYWSRIQRNR